MNAVKDWYREPVLELEQIQGIAVPGFIKPYQTLICVRHASDEETIVNVRAFLRQLLPHLTNGNDALADRRAHRAHRRAGERGAPPEGPPLLAIGFTYPGLFSLTPSAESMTSQAFKLGLPARSALLGDPVERDHPGHPSKWAVGAPGREPHFMVVVAGDDKGRVHARAEAVIAQLRGIGLDDHVRQDGHKHGGKVSREHFGFADGISQPGIRGVDPVKQAYVTDRHIDPATQPDASLYGYPGQDLVWPGEFVFGYPRSGPDPLLPGPLADAGPPWTRNGSYLVYNRLVQDVRLFWRTMRSEARRLAELPGFAALSEESLAELMVGRTRSGAPISRLRGTGCAAHPGLGSDEFANNDFRFDSDTPRPLRAQGEAYPQALADPIGQTCPLASHIRKVNPRDATTDVGGPASTYAHRILRVGVPFGEPLADPHARPRDDEKEEERGLLFLAIQSSIEEQFEFLQARWMNDDRRPKAPSGHDMVAGRNPVAGDATRRCVIFGSDNQAATVEARKPFVIPTGGGYFFVPALDAIRDVLAVR